MPGQAAGEDPPEARDGRPAARCSPRPAAGDAVPGATEAGAQGGDGGGGGGAADAGEGEEEEEDGGGEARREEEAVRRDPAAADALAGGAVPARAPAAPRLLLHGDQRPPRGRHGHHLAPRAGGR